MFRGGTERGAVGVTNGIQWEDTQHKLGVSNGNFGICLAKGGDVIVAVVDGIWLR